MVNSQDQAHSFFKVKIKKFKPKKLPSLKFNRKLILIFFSILSNILTVKTLDLTVLISNLRVKKNFTDLKNILIKMAELL